MLHRSIMLHAEDRIHALITRLRESAAPPERQALLDELTEIEASVHEVAHSVVDYQHVMDELDDNILVADKDEVVLYVNDAYIRHTGIAPEQILGKRITELLETGTYFTDPTVPDVIRSRKKVMKLSSMFGRPDSLGFVTGVPIFDDAGEIQYVVACNRGVSTFKELRDNFVHFVEAVNNLQGAAGHVQMVPNSSGIVTPQMVGESPAIQRVYDLIENVRQTTATVLITGESGVGKELIADAIYRTSSRAEKPFIKVNCASIPASLFESAEIDGCSPMGTFFKIVLPLSKAALTAIGLMFAVQYWNDYTNYKLYITNENLYNFQMKLRSLILGSDLPSAVGSATENTIKNAAVIVAILPFVIIYPFCQKYFISGVNIGAVKE